MVDLFRFKRFSVRNEQSALKVGTDAVLLGALMRISPSDERALDIGTGTGVIALMAAQRSDSLIIDAIDIDTPSFEEASYNFSQSLWSARLNAYRADLRQFQPSQHYDLIFSNPPFYDNSLRNPDAREARARHDESLSFADILSFASRHLSTRGRLALIVPADRLKSLLRTAGSFGLFPCNIVMIKTTARKEAKRAVIELSFSKLDSYQEEILVLMDGASRSVEYRKLTEDFYIN